MSGLYLTAEERDFSAPRQLPLLTYNVRSYSKNHVGGPVQASISAHGPDAEVWELINLLRTPVSIFNDTGTKVWWGYIAEVRIVVGVLTVAVTLDLMRNRIAVNYSTSDGAVAGTTEFAQDDDSVAAFGIRELLDNMPNADLTQALNYRDTLLEIRKKAIPAWAISGTARSSSGEIILRGWWSTLDWIYYNASAVQQEVDGTIHADSAFGMYINTTLISYNRNYNRFILHDTQSVNEANGIHQMPIDTYFYITQTGTTNSLHGKVFHADGASGGHFEVTDDTISFDAGSKQITCSNPVFSSVRVGDHIRIMGSGSNDGYYTAASSATSTVITVSEALVTEAAGSSVTVRRGPYFRATPVTSGVVTEMPNPATTTYLQEPSNVAQSFQLTPLTTLDVQVVRVKMKRSDPISTTQQYVHLQIRDDSGGVPAGTIVPNGSSTKALQDLPSAGYDWVVFEFVPTFNIVSGTTYWLYFYRTMDASASKSNQVMVGVDQTGPNVTGVLKSNEDFGGENWVEVTGDILFTLSGAVQTTELLSAILTDAGQFFTDVVIEDDSGVTAALGRDGSQTALQEAENLISIGTSNSKPLLVDLDENRVARVYEEPNPVDVYFLDLQGRLYNSAMSYVEPSTCPVGFWVRLKDVIPIEVDIATLADPSLVFIEEAEYSVQDERLTIRPRGALSPWSVTKIRRG